MNSLKIPTGLATVSPESTKDTFKSYLNYLSQEPTIFLKSLESESVPLSIIINSSKTIGYVSRSDGSVLELNISPFFERSSWNLHDSSILSISISSTDTFLLTSSKDLKVSVWNLKRERRAALFKCSWKPDTVRITKDEKLVCIAGNHSSILIWDFFNNSPIIELIGHTEIVTSLVLMGNELFSGSNDNSIKLWDLGTMKEKRTLLGHSSLINCLKLNHSRDLLASGSADYSIRLWDIKGNKESQVLSGHTGEIYVLDFSKDDRFLASGSQDKTARVWNIKTGIVEFIQDNHNNYISSLLIFNDFLISGSIKDIFLDDIKEKKNKLALDGQKSRVCDFCVLKKENKLISTNTDKTIKLWDISNESEKIVLNGHKDDISALIITKDNKYIISGSWDYFIKIWCLEGKREIRTLKGHKHYVSRLAATSDSLKVISASWDCTIKIWTIPDGLLLHSIDKFDTFYFRLELTCNNKYFFTSSGDAYLRVWDLEQYSASFEYYMGEPITSILSTNDSKNLIVSSVSSQLIFINLQSMSVTHKQNFNIGIVGCCLSDNHKKIFICLQNSTIQIWDLDSLKQIGLLKGHNANWPINIICLNSKYFALISDDCELKIFNYVKVYEAASFIMPCVIKSMEKTACGSYLILGCSDGKIVVVNPAEKRFECHYYGHTGMVTMIAKSKGDKFIVSGSKDCSIIIWKVYKFMRKKTVSDKKTLLNETKFYSLTEKSIESELDSERKNTWELYGYPAVAINGFRQRLYRKMKPQVFDCFVIILGINLVHIYSYFGMYTHLEVALNYGCQIRKDLEHHSPLYYAISKNSQKCIDVILTHVIGLSQKSDNLNLYFESNFALKDDFYDIIQFSSPLIPQYLQSLFLVSNEKNLPNSIRCFSPPAILFMKQQRVLFEYFQESFSKITNSDMESFVVFKSTPIKLNLTSGSMECFNLLHSLSVSKNNKIFTTELIKTILDYKFRSYSKIIKFLVVVQLCSLLSMLFCIYTDDPTLEWMLAFLLITILQFVHETLQFKYESQKFYFKFKRNTLDLLTLLLIIAWIILKFSGFSLKILMWLMVFFNYLKGLSVFKAFDATRFYIGLLAQCISETYSFLLIFLYSILAFGGLNMVSVEKKYSNFELLWKMPYELNFGVFLNDEEFNLQYLYFVLGSLLNIIVMLNLLIAILGDTFDKYQIIAPELDYIEKLGVIFEVESILSVWTWKKTQGFMQICDFEEKDNTSNEWEGKIRKIEVSIEKFSHEIKTRLDSIDQSQENLNAKLDKLLNNPKNFP